MASFRLTNKLEDVARFLRDNRKEEALLTAVKQVDDCNDVQAIAKIDLYRSCVERLARMIELYEGGYST